MPAIYVLAWESLGDDLRPSEDTVALRSLLQQHTAERVEVRPAQQAVDESDVFLVFENGFTELPDWIASLPDARRRDVFARTFLFGGVRSPSFFKTLEEYELCGGVDSISHFGWVAKEDTALIGLRGIAERLGDLPKPSVLNHSEHYAMYRSRAAKTLPQAIVEYFAELARERGR